MTGSALPTGMLFPLLRGMAAAEIARAFGESAPLSPPAATAPNRSAATAPAPSAAPQPQTAAPPRQPDSSPAPQRPQMAVWMSGLTPPRTILARAEAFLPDLASAPALQAGPAEGETRPLPAHPSGKAPAPGGATPAAGGAAPAATRMAAEPAPRMAASAAPAAAGFDPSAAPSTAANPAEAEGAGQGMQAARAAAPQVAPPMAAQTGQPPADAPPRSMPQAAAPQAAPLPQPAPSAPPAPGQTAQPPTVSVTPTAVPASALTGHDTRPTDSAAAQPPQAASQPQSAPSRHALPLESRQASAAAMADPSAPDPAAPRRDATDARPMADPVAPRGADRPAQPSAAQPAAAQATRPDAPRQADPRAAALADPPPAPRQTAQTPLQAALTAAILSDKATYGAFPFMAEGGAAQTASLVIFNAAMIPSWPPAFRLDLSLGNQNPIQLAGADLSQMSPEEAAEYLSKMAASFGFLLTVKKRLASTLKEEKELLLGLFSFLGLAFDSLVKGLRNAIDLTVEQQEMLAEVLAEAEGKKPGQKRRRLQL